MLPHLILSTAAWSGRLVRSSRWRSHVFTICTSLKQGWGGALCELCGKLKPGLAVGLRMGMYRIAVEALKTCSKKKKRTTATTKKLWRRAQNCKFSLDAMFRDQTMYSTFNVLMVLAVESPPQLCRTGLQWPKKKKISDPNRVWVNVNEKYACEGGIFRAGDISPGHIYCLMACKPHRATESDNMTVPTRGTALVNTCPPLSRPSTCFMRDILCVVNSLSYQKPLPLHMLIPKHRPS